VEAARPAVQLVRPLVRRESHRAPVELEGRAADAVGAAADHDAEVGRVRQVAGQVAVAEDDVGDPALAVGHAHLEHGGAEIEQRRRRCRRGRSGRGG
jgi:hypothetical protein